MLKNILICITFFLLYSYSNAQEIQHPEVGDFIIRGNKKLKTSFIRLLSNVKPGAKLDSTVLKQDIIRLKRLPAVSHAYYQVFYSHDNKYNV